MKALALIGVVWAVVIAAVSYIIGMTPAYLDHVANENGILVDKNDNILPDITSGIWT